MLILIVFLIAIFSIDHLASDDDDSVFNTIIEWKQAFFEAPETMMLSSLRDDFLHNNMSLLPHQTDYIVELTQKHQDVLDFHKLYCVGGDKTLSIWRRFRQVLWSYSDVGCSVFRLG